MADYNLEPSSNSDSRYRYDVFLSFRGEDTRNTFTDHLYTALVQAGHRTFRDEEEIRTGECIKSELVNAIQQSRGSIIVFSRTYAFSRWCLDELVMIMALNKNNITRGSSSNKFVVLPVFYDVDPNDIRRQSGIVGEAFAKYKGRMKGEKDEGKVKEWMKNLKCWREALAEAADLTSRMVLQPGGKESKFIQKVVAVIRDNIRRPVFYVGPHLVGIQERAKRISKWLEEYESAHVNVIGIFGMGGIGKTTIAKYVYNQHSQRFEGSCFLANVREMSKQPNGLASLQNQLLSDLTKGKKEKNNEGMFKYAISGRRILLVLDDVDHVDQLKAILGRRDWFFPGSKIVITTRHERLLKLSEVDKVYEVEKLKDSEALELMSYHAFGKKPPNEDFINHIEKAVRLCEGLPLALKVVGSSLCGQTVDYWLSALEKLEAIPNSDILEKLKISYDSLQDDHDKHLFLHIACFFTYQEKNCVITILDECEFYTTVGIQNLIDRSLITSSKGILVMHQLLQDMGREIVRLESPRYPGKRSRLWRHKESFDVLRTKTGTETIEGLVLNMQMVELERPVDTGSREIYSKRPYYELDNPQKRRRVSLISWRTGKMPSSDSRDADLETDAFEKMENLKLLQLYYAKLTGSYGSFPQNLRLLCWHGFPRKAIPLNLPLDSVVSLDMQHSSLQKVWQGNRFLGSLKILNLSYSKRLVETPNFSGTPKLETLMLKGCISLSEVCESIGFLAILVVLDLEDCENLSKLPTSICKLTSLQILNLSGCPKAMASLGVPLADHGIPTNSVSTTFTKIVSWNAFLWPWMSKRSNISDIGMISLPFCLRELYLSSCNLSEGSFPHDLSNLSALDKLVLSNNPLRSLPDCITDLYIGELVIESCEQLHSLCGLPDTLEILRIGDNSSLVRVDSIDGRLGKDTQLVYPDCPKLASIDNCFLLEHITEVDKEIIDNLGFQDIELLGKIELNIYEDTTISREKHPIQVSHPIQGMHEFGIFSTFVPGVTVPSWFTETKVTGPSISFMVPPNVRIQCLNLCFSLLYRINQETHDQDDDEDPWFADVVFVKINNKTKNLSWIYCPLFSQLQSDDVMAWLSQWKFGDDELDGGDQVTITFAISNDLFEVKGCGYNLVFHENYSKKGKGKEEEKEDGVIGGNLRYYQFRRPGSYYLTHRYLFSGHQSEYLRTKNWLHDIFGDSISAQELARPCWKGWWR